MSESPGDDPPERDPSDGALFAYARRDGVLQARREGTRWLSTGWNGGETVADAAYNVTVPEGFDRRDLDAYARERREGAGFDAPGPTLFTGVSQAHARGARAEPVEAVATVGLSNPATLPGTVNIIFGTSRALDEGALASLLATVVEARTATLLHETGFTGTTTDAVVVGCDPAGPEAAFAGTATDLGGAARACVREAVRASLRSRYGDESPPASVEAASYGRATDRRADLFRPE